MRRTRNRTSKLVREVELSGGRYEGGNTLHEKRSAAELKHQINSTMAIAGQLAVEDKQQTIPATMLAAVYRGMNDVRMETVPGPEDRPRRIAGARAHLWGLRHGSEENRHRLTFRSAHFWTRDFGHDCRRGRGCTRFSIRRPGCRFPSHPVRKCYYCRNKTFAQCETYKKVGCTAGFEPSGGGFAEYVRAMDWIAQRGTVRIPENVSYEQACFVEPINTCMKGIERLGLQRRRDGCSNRSGSHRYHVECIG